MFNRMNQAFQGLTLGAGVLAGTIGISGQYAEAAEPTADAHAAKNKPVATRPAPENSRFHVTAEREDQSLDVSSGIAQLSGALKGVHPPLYDGPVVWRDGRADFTRVEQALFAGAASAIIAAGMGTLVLRPSSSRAGREMAKVALASAVLGFSGSYLTHEPADIITLRTTVSEASAQSDAHYKERNSGSDSTVDGPFFPQLVRIPETALLLASGAKGAPLVAGENIDATFHLDGDGRILSWFATPAPRE